MWWISLRKDVILKLSKNCFSRRTTVATVSRLQKSNREAGGNWGRISAGNIDSVLLAGKQQLGKKNLHLTKYTWQPVNASRIIKLKVLLTQHAQIYCSTQNIFEN